MFKFIANLFKSAPVAAAPIMKTPKRQMRRKRTAAGKQSMTSALRKLAVGQSIIVRRKKGQTVSGGMLTVLANEGSRFSQRRMRGGILMTRVS